MFRRGTLNLFQSKFLWAVVVVVLALLLVCGSYVFKAITSVYKTDLGNGVVLYADDYVNSGHWVFDCGYSRLVSRAPLPVPLDELNAGKKIAVGELKHLGRLDEPAAKEAISAIIARPEWYGSLEYVYSGVGERSEIWRHKFFGLADYAGIRWAIEVSQVLRLRGGAKFVVIGKPYDPETYVDYTKAFDAAVKSCPAPQ